MNTRLADIFSSPALYSSWEKVNKTGDITTDIMSLGNYLYEAMSPNLELKTCIQVATAILLDARQEKVKEALGS